MPRMVLAEQWYESAEFWTAASVGTTLLVGIIGAAVAYAVGFPRRRLRYGVGSLVPLLSEAAGTHSDLELRHQGRLLSDVHVLDIVLAGQGATRSISAWRPESTWFSRRGQGPLPVRHQPGQPSTGSGQPQASQLRRRRMETDTQTQQVFLALVAAASSQQTDDEMPSKAELADWLSPCLN
jgi:hypothetical protein